MSYVFEKTSISSSLTINKSNFGGLPRSLDILIAGLGLIAVSPIILLCGILVRLSSRGPVLFRQNRVGRRGEIFTFYKFRTMYSRTGGPAITSADDRRVTKIGRFLRRYKLDELPELFNVLRGDMAFIGARPEVPEMVDMTDYRWQKVLEVRPGITDPVTLKLRNEEIVLAEADDKMTFYREVLQPFKLNGYLDYLNSRTWKSDLLIIFQTIKVIVMPHTAPQPTVDELALLSIGATRHE